MERPGVALFCATFLKPEMLHVHRHVAGLNTFRPLVLAQKLEGDWPVDQLTLVPRSPWRFVARASERQTGRPWQISRGETESFLEAMATHRSRLLHIFFGNVAVHLLPLVRRCPVPVVVSFHGSDVAGSMTSPGYANAVKELFDRASLVPCRSTQLAGAVARLGCDEDKLRLMRTILPETTFVQRRAPFDGGWKLVQAARLVAKKGVATTLRAFGIMRKNHPRATLVIAGDGPLEVELRKLAEELGVADAVRFVGFCRQPELREIFQQSHIYLHPSETAEGDVEGIPNALLEAMAGGLPPVATDHGGIPEVIIPGQNGFLCPEKNPETLAETLEELISLPERYAAISRAASETVRAGFSATRQVNAIESLYHEAINRSASTHLASQL